NRADSTKTLETLISERLGWRRHSSMRRSCWKKLAELKSPPEHQSPNGVTLLVSFISVANHPTVMTQQTRSKSRRNLLTTTRLREVASNAQLEAFAFDGGPTNRRLWCLFASLWRSD